MPNFSFIEDSRWSDLDETKKRGMLELAFEEKVASDPRFDDLPDNKKVAMRNLFMEEANAYQANILAEENREYGLLESVGKGLAHGTLGIAESIGTGLQWAGNRLGSETVADTGKTTSEYWGKKAEKYGPPGILAGKNVVDEPEILGEPTFWTYNISDMFPTLFASILPGAAAGKAIQAATAIPKLATIGGMVAGGVTGGALEGAQTYKQILKEGGTEEEAARAAELMTLGSGVLNALSVGKILNKAGTGFKNKVIKHLGAGAWEGITEGLEEPTEVFSKYLGAYLADEPLPKDLSTQLVESIKDALTVAPIAGITGFGGSIVGSEKQPVESFSDSVEGIAKAETADEAIAAFNKSISTEGPKVEPIASDINEINRKFSDARETPVQPIAPKFESPEIIETKLREKSPPSKTEEMFDKSLQEEAKKVYETEDERKFTEEATTLITPEAQEVVTRSIKRLNQAKRDAVKTGDWGYYNELKSVIRKARVHTTPGGKEALTYLHREFAPELTEPAEIRTKAKEPEYDRTQEGRMAPIQPEEGLEREEAAPGGTVPEPGRSGKAGIMGEVLEKEEAEVTPKKFVAPEVIEDRIKAAQEQRQAQIEAEMPEAEVSTGKQVEKAINGKKNNLVKYDGPWEGTEYEQFTTQEDFGGLPKGQTFVIKGEPTVEKVETALIRKSEEYGVEPRKLEAVPEEVKKPEKVEGVRVEKAIEAEKPAPKKEAKAERKEPLGSKAYIQAKKLPDGTYQLFYRGTRNEVFPGEIFKSAKEARDYFDVQKLKQESTKEEPPPSPEGTEVAPEVEGVEYPIYQTKVKVGDNIETRYAVPASKKMGFKEGFGDALFKTKAEAEEYRLQQIKSDKDVAKRESEAIKKETESKQKESEIKNIDGFADDLTPMQRGKIVKTLNKQMRFDGEISTVKDKVKELVDSGAELSTYEENVIKPMSRRRYNRANQREQDLHEKKMRESGKKTVYMVGDYDLGKTAYDYANHLKSLSEKPTEPIGTAWVKNVKKPILSAREITRGKDKGKVEVTLTAGRDAEGNIKPGKKFKIEKKSVVEWPGEAETKPETKPKEEIKITGKEKPLKLYEGDYVKFKNSGGQEFYGDVTKVYEDTNTVNIQADGAKNSVEIPTERIIGLEKGGRLRERTENEIKITGKEDKTVSVEMPESKAEDLTPKEQKKYLLAEIDKAIDTAVDDHIKGNNLKGSVAQIRKEFETKKDMGSLGSQFYKFEVPGDGEFDIAADSLIEFKKRVKSQFPAAVRNEKFRPSTEGRINYGIEVKKYKKLIGKPVEKLKPADIADINEKIRKAEVYNSNHFTNWLLNEKVSDDVKKEILKQEGIEAKPKLAEGEKKPAPKTEKIEGRVEDVGEKLFGSRKDLAQSLKSQVSDDDISSNSLSKIWPKPKIEDLDDSFASAFNVIARSIIPSKPRLSYKLKRWAEQVKILRGFAEDILNGKISEDELIKKIKSTNGLRDFTEKIEAIREIDKSLWYKVKSIDNAPNAYSYDKDGNKYTSPFFNVNGKSYRYKNNIDEVISEVEKDLGISKPSKKMQFQVRGSVRSGYFINKKGDPEYRHLKEFETSKDAFDFIKNNHTDLLNAWEEVKARDNIHEKDVRAGTNKPRTGKDYRKGRDVDAENFRNAFGFRGVEFGNWVKQGKNTKERQGMINAAYDALMDLSDLLNIPAEAISLNGSLGLGFGSRGRGWASAHYEPDTLVINLTKTRGAGTLAHEWFHALDNYFQLKRETGGTIREDTYITYKPETIYRNKETGKTLTERQYKYVRDNRENWVAVEGVRPEVLDKFAKLVDELNKSDMAKRSRRIDKGKSKGYWSRIIERAARSFENYIIAKMEDAGYDNDYLANVVKIEDFGKNLERYPYLKADEIPPIKEAFDELFKTIKTKKTDKGTLLYSTAEPKFQYEQCCVDISNADVEHLDKMIDDAKEVSYDTFIRNVGTKQLAEMFPFYDWGRGQKGGLRLKNDFHVSYNKSKYKDRPCYYMVHSAIEYIFTSPDMRYSSSEKPKAKTTEDQVWDIILPYMQNMTNFPTVRVVQSVDNLPKRLKSKVSMYSKLSNKQVEGFYDKVGDQVYLIADNLSEGRTEAVLRHEAEGHRGIRLLLGPELDDFLDGVAEAKKHLLVMHDPKLNLKDQAAVRVAADEWVARKIEAGNLNKSLWNDLIRIFRKWLRKFIPNLELKDSEIRSILTATVKNVREGRIDRMREAQGKPRFSGIADKWYSQMTKFLSEKLPGKGSPAQFKTSINSWKTKGLIKKEELEWSGLLDWLKETSESRKESISEHKRNIGLQELIIKNAEKEANSERFIRNAKEIIERHKNEIADLSKGKITKQQVLDYLAENNVQIQEVEKGEGFGPSKDLIDVFETEDSEGNSVLKMQWSDVEGVYAYSYDGGVKFELYEGDDYLSDVDKDTATSWLLDKIEEYYPQTLTKEETGDTKFSQWVLPGGKGYRELLLKMPQKAPKRQKVQPDFKHKIVSDQWRGDHVTFDFEGEHYVAPLSGRTPQEAAQARVDRLAEPDIPMGYKDKFGHAQAWGESNILVHIRFDERTGPNGEKILHIAEIQSDWHQEGRKKGYETKKAIYKIKREDGSYGLFQYDTIGEAKEGIKTGDYEGEKVTIEKVDERITGVPQAPFKKTWPLLTIKRMVRFASENGFDILSWDTGEVQADRYDLSKQLDSIEIVGRTDARTGEKSRSVWLNPKSGGQLQIGVDNKGIVDNVSGGNEAHIAAWEGKPLSDVIGKDIAEKVMKSDPGTIFRGDDLKTDAPGMKAFYDKMIPAAVNKFFNKKTWGKAKVGEIEIPQDKWQGTISANMADGKRIVISYEDATERWYAIDPETSKTIDFDSTPRKIAKKLGATITTPISKFKAHSLPITSEMREKALGEGMPLFSNLLFSAVSESDFKKSTSNLFEKAKMNYKAFTDKTGIAISKSFSDNAPKDLLKGFRWIQTMQDMAKNFPNMARLFTAEKKRVADSNAMSIRDRETTDPYFTLSKESRERVNQALLDGDENSEVYTSKQLKDEFGLNQAEINGYKAVREVLEEKMDDHIRRVLADVVNAERTPITDELIQDVKKCKSKDELKDVLMAHYVSEYESKKLPWLVDWIKEFKGYIPHTWNAEWLVKVNLGKNNEHMFEVPTAGGRLKPTRTGRLGSAKKVAYQVIKDRLNLSDKKIMELAEKGKIDVIKSRELPIDLFEGARMDVIQSIVNEAQNKMWQETVQHMSKDQAAKFKDMQEILKKHVEEMYLAKGWGRHLMGRRGVKGYRTDIENVLSSYLNGANKFTAKGEAAKEFARVMKDISPTQTPNQWKHGKQYISDMLGESSEAGWFKKIAGTWFLAGDVSAATLNMTQNWTHAVALLRGIKAKGVAEKDIYNAMKDVFKQYLKNKKKGLKPFDEATDMAEDEIDALKSAVSHGILDPAFLGEMTGYHQNKIWQDYSQKVFGAMFKMFTGAEGWNRTSTFLAAYRRAKRSGMAEGEAMEKAASIVEGAHFTYGKGNRPQAVRATGAVGNVAFTFMTYPLNNLVFLKHRCEDILTDFHKGDRAALKRDMKILGSNLGYLFAFGGVMGLPFSYIAQSILNLFDDDEEDWEILIRKHMPKTMGRAVFRGVPAAFLGNDMSWRVQGTDVVGMPIGFQILGMGKKRIEQAHKTWEQGDELAAFFHLMPDMVRNPYRAVMGYKEGGTRTGVPPIRYTPGEAITKALSFTPTREAETWKAGSVTKKARQIRLDNLANFSERYLAAMKKGDVSRSRKLREELEEYNRRQRRKGRKGLEISWKDVLKSAKSRKKFRGKSYREHVPKYMQKYQEEIERAIGL